MAIPFATTTITVLRPQTSDDPYDPPSGPPVEVETGVRAHIGSMSGRERVEGGQQSVTDLRLTCDPVDIEHTDQVRDDLTGETFQVLWVKQRTTGDLLGNLEHTTAYLQHVEGAV